MNADVDWPECAECDTNVLVARVPGTPELDWQCYGCGIRWSA